MPARVHDFVHYLWSAYMYCGEQPVVDALSLCNIRLINTELTIKDPADRRKKKAIPVLAACLVYDAEYEQGLIELEREQAEEATDEDH